MRVMGGEEKTEGKRYNVLDDPSIFPLSTRVGCHFFLFFLFCRTREFLLGSSLFPSFIYDGNDGFVVAAHINR